MTGRRPYPSDISDARWALIEPALTAWQQPRIDRRPTGEPAHTDLREVVNALLYINRTGISWRYIPHDLPLRGRAGAVDARADLDLPLRSEAGGGGREARVRGLARGCGSPIGDCEMRQHHLPCRSRTGLTCHFPHDHFSFPADSKIASRGGEGLEGGYSTRTPAPSGSGGIPTVSIPDVAGVSVDDAIPRSRRSMSRNTTSSDSGIRRNTAARVTMSAPIRPPGGLPRYGPADT